MLIIVVITITSHQQQRNTHSRNTSSLFCSPFVEWYKDAQEQVHSFLFSANYYVIRYVYMVINVTHFM